MKVLLVEDHELFRDGVTMILESLDATIDVIWRDTVSGVRELYKEESDLDLVLLDYNLPDGNGIECLKDILAKEPNTPTIILSAEQDAELIQRALAAGAKGFITKTSPSKVILSAIRLVLSGGVYIPPELLAPQQNTSPLSVPPSIYTSSPKEGPRQEYTSIKHHQLTARQTNVLAEVVKGLANKEIARELNMSPSTVKVHVAAILREFDVKNRTQAVSYARKNGLA